MRKVAFEVVYWVMLAVMSFTVVVIMMRIFDQRSIWNARR